MEQPQEHTPVSSPSVRRHGRSPSGEERRRGLPRRIARGSLDEAEDDPLSPPRGGTQVRAISPVIRTTPIMLKPPRSPRRGLSRSPTRALDDVSSKDFSFLLRTENFLPLPQDLLPAPFLTSLQAGDVRTPVDILVQSGHFYTAAIAAAQQLTRMPRPPDVDLLFGLLHVRLSCLTLLGQAQQAASESKVLGDMSSSFYRDTRGVHIVPWDLRVLAIRLQALGFGEWRRGIMQHYTLASEARQAILVARQNHDTKAEGLWTARLRDLGVRVASVLVEMGDMEAAARHLRTLHQEPNLPPEDRRRLSFNEALVWLRLGDLRTARRCIQPTSSPSPSGSDPDYAAILSALLKTAEGDFIQAAAEWRSLPSEDAMIRQNLAVCLLYTGNLTEAREILQQLVDSGEGFKALLFNLCTVHELCTDKSTPLKLGLVQVVVGRPVDESGWEKGAGEFKL